MTRVLTQIDFYNARPGIWNLTADFRPEDVPILTGLEFYELGELIDCANARCMRQKLEKTFIYMEGAFLGPQSFIPLLDEFRFLKIDEEFLKNSLIEASADLFEHIELHLRMIKEQFVLLHKRLLRLTELKRITSSSNMLDIENFVK